MTQINFILKILSILKNNLKSYSSLFIVFLIFCSTSSLFAQWEKVAYDELSGLQNPLVKSTCTDSLGFVWLATDNGLIRFDGTNFLQLKRGLPNKYVKFVFTTSKGKTLATTDLGLVKINTHPRSPTVETIIKGDNYASDTLMWYPKSIYESYDGNLWVTDNHAIYKLDANLQLLNRYQFSERDLPTNFQRSFTILQDPLLGIYTFSEAGYLYKYNQKDDSFEEVPILTHNGRVSHAFFYKGKIIAATQFGVVEVILDKDGSEVLSQKVIIPYLSVSWISLLSSNEWIVSTWSDGVFKIKVTNNDYFFEKIDLVKQKVISSVFIDKSKNIWLSTDNGIIYLRSQYFDNHFRKYTSGYIQTIIQDEDKVIFTDGKTVFLNETKSNTLLGQWKIPNKYGIVLRIKKIEDQYWMSTNIGMLLAFSNDGKLVNKVDCSINGGAIYDMAYSPDLGLWYVQDHGGLFHLQNMKNPVSFGREDGVTSKINTLKIIENQLYLGGSKDEGYFFKYNKDLRSFKNLSRPVAVKRNIPIGINDILPTKEGFYFATNFGITNFYGDSLVSIKINGIDVGAVKGIIQDYRDRDVFWFSNSMGLIRTVAWKDYLIFDEISGLPSKTMVYRGILLDNKGEIWVGTASGIGVSKKLVKIKNTPSPIFTSIRNSDFHFNKEDVPEISKSSYLEFEFSSLSYPGNLILYKIRYNDEDWKDLGWSNKFIASGLERGKYTFEIKAKQTGEYMWSAPTKFDFIITERWYRTWYGVLGALSVLLGIIFIIFKLYDEKNQHDKEILEKLVSERTEEVKQKNKILSNRELILKKQVSKFMKLNQIQDQKQNEMKEQLNYAHSLQSVVLPSLGKLNEYCSDSFIIFKPKEIVSGDFYWGKSYVVEDRVISYYVVGDSIGHGISGVIQALIGVNLLNEIVRKPEMKTNEVLEHLDAKLYEKAKKDPIMIGMDLVVLRITRVNDQIQVEFSGAKRPLFYLENNSLVEIKGTRRAIGNEPNHVKEKGYKVHHLDLNKGTVIYLTTNGFYDQFNKSEKRIGIASFRNLLEGLSKIDKLSDQKEWMENYYLNWKGNAEQIDDVTLLGLRL